jgi:hypothetical protein
VVGIAGVRGAGKSSLAKKTLDACATEGYFTLLIPSPISYEPREFLLAIFQRIVESAQQRLTATVEGAEELIDAGREKAREVRRALIILTIGIIFSVVTAAALQYYFFTQYRAAVETQQFERYEQEEKIRNERRKQEYNDRLNDLDRKIADTTDAEEKKKLSSDRSDIMDRRRFIDEDSLMSRSFRRGDVLTVPITVFACAIVYVFAVLLGVVVKRLYKKYRKFAAHPKEVGMLIECREMLELITYQATLSSGRDIGLKASWLSGKISSNKQLAERPLSLPGLTATCTKFLSDLAEVFGFKVVICIDELDKITDAMQLMELLKGIKGILSQDRSHFLLTISEDAMGYFTERLSAERNLIESSFEQIVYLDRLSSESARQLIKQSVSVDIRDGLNFRANSDLLWIFAGGIPREIRRNIFAVHSAQMNLGSAAPIAVWKLLYLEVIIPMQINPPRSAPLESQFRFLKGLEALLELVHSTSLNNQFQELMEVFSGIVTEWFKELITPEDEEDAKFSNAPYLSLVAQIVVGFLSLGGVLPRSQDHAEMDSLVYVSKYVPINPRYALYGLRKFLGGQQLKYLYEDTESTAGFEEAIGQASTEKRRSPPQKRSKLVRSRAESG